MHSIAAAFGATATLKYDRVYPATVNSEREAVFAARVADTLVGAENVVRDLEPSMGSEDFSFMLQRRPGAYARLGQGGAEGGCFLHNTRYDFNDEVIPLGAGYLAALAEAAMPLNATARRDESGRLFRRKLRRSAGQVPFRRRVCRRKRLPACASDRARRRRRGVVDRFGACSATPMRPVSCC